MTKQQSVSPEWVLNMIERVGEYQLTGLDLSNIGLRIIPDTIGQLKNLQRLKLGGNLLTNIPDVIGNLINLQELDLQENSITTVSNEIIHLTNLRELNLNNNKLTDIPDSICQLEKMERLDLSHNELGSISERIAHLENLNYLDLSHNLLKSFPDAILELTQLQTLMFDNNQLAVLPDEISKLINLQFLYLGSNLLTDIPNAISRLINIKTFDFSYNKLKFLPTWVIELPKLERLDLYGNPIEVPPPEILQLKMFESIDLNVLRAFFRQQAEAGKEAIYEAKLLIVGEPGAGKTSLARKLIQPSAPLPAKDESTEGIDVHIWKFPIPGSYSAHQTSELLAKLPLDFQVNIWDFGGQSIYYATHQFFLSRRSLYIIVADAREQKNDFFYWLDLIEHLSDRSPVIIFNNEIQNRRWSINEQQLKYYFPETFQRPFGFNLRDDTSELAILRRKIQEYITQLPHVGTLLPKTWVDVRRALENDQRSTITIQEFLKLCEKNGFTRDEDALQLSTYLHDIGVILHFQDDPLLKRIVILKPEWGTEAVYRVLDNEQVKDHLGLFNYLNLRHIWHETRYANLQLELVTLMMKFQLCYEIPGRAGTFIAPQLLGEQPPKYQWSNEGNLHLRYRYEAFMPKGLISRFIVAIHPFIAKQRYVWRTGVVLFKDQTAAEVTEFYHSREIRIRVAGKNKRDLLTIIIYELDRLQKRFHRLKFSKLIPCNCSTCRVREVPHFYKLDVLKTRLEHGKQDIECDEPPFEKVPIRPLLDDVGTSVDPAKLPSLLQRLNHDFDDNEFRTLCFELGIKYENLADEGLKGKQREFLLLLERNGRLPELINLLRQKRPNFNW